MLTHRKRGKTFHADLLRGGAPRVRGSLGTKDEDAAKRLIHRLGIALSEGPGSMLWPELFNVLPRETYDRFARFVGVTRTKVYTWDDLRTGFKRHLDVLVKTKERSSATAERYDFICGEFEAFLVERGISFLRDITKSLVRDDFRSWRFDRIIQNGGAGGSLRHNLLLLHAVFAYAVEENMLTENPVTIKGLKHQPKHFEPFSTDELAQLRRHAGEDRMVFLVLRWTGFRGSDARVVTFEEANLDDRKELDHVARKNKKQVILPLYGELLAALEADRITRSARPSDLILLNPNTGGSFSKNGLYGHVVRMGKRAGLAHAHPHRFRVTRGVELLLQGWDVYHVARLLGDTVKTVIDCYLPFVRKLRERFRSKASTEPGFGDELLVPLTGADARSHLGNEDGGAPIPEKRLTSSKNRNCEQIAVAHSEVRNLLSHRVAPASEDSILRYSRLGRRVLRFRRAQQEEKQVSPERSA